METPTDLQANVVLGDRVEFPSNPLMGNQEMQLVNCNFSESKLGKVKVDGIKPEKDAGHSVKEETFFEIEEESNESVVRLTHLGFHAQPSTTPTIVATQRGAMNTMSSVNTSQIVGRCKISNKAETKAISYATGILKFERNINRAC